MKINKLYDKLGKIRDLNIQARDDAKTEVAKKYFDGMATAYDTVRGWVFEMIGENESEGEE